jgi:phage shock protein E
VYLVALWDISPTNPFYMLNWILNLGRSNIKKALQRGAIIIDVRTGIEYDQGHVPGAWNIPVDRISINTGRIRAAKRPVILCCNSGARSSMALQLLKEQGITDVYNGGNWENVLKVISRL